jgi:hypothetical protein
MPSFKMTDQELVALRAFVMSQAWTEYEARQNGNP